MSVENPSISTNIFKEQQAEFLKTLKNQLNQNPKLADSGLADHANVDQFSKYFLNQITSKIVTNTLPNINHSAFEPILSLWHSLIGDFTKSGFSTKDITMLIYAFKTSFQSFKTNHKIPSNSPLQQFEQVLDFLGILTFEIYSVENERLLTRKNEQIQYLQQQEPQFAGKMIGNSVAMAAVYKAMGLILDNDLTVLLEGESGTGKDLIATTIHQHSTRAKKPFVAINCGAIPKELIESELFGHEKGAFTGANEQRIGKFELADGGTLFLDEVGELPLDLQVKLLRVLQNKQIERIGSDKSITLDVRIIAATNIGLKQAVDKKTFRLDLYYRLHIFPIHIPALRDRVADIEPLTYYFIDKYTKEFNLEPVEITEEAIQYLKHLTWEGNIRELENTIQRSLVLAQGKPISSAILRLMPGQLEIGVESVPLLLPERVQDPNSGLKEMLYATEDTILSLEEEEKRVIQRAVTIKKGNIMQIAKALNISRTTLYSKMAKYNIS